MTASSTSDARRELDALKEEIAKLERLAGRFDENNELINHQINRTLVAQQTVNAAMPRAAASGAMPRPPQGPPPLSQGTVSGRSQVPPAPPPRRAVDRPMLTTSQADPILEESFVAALSAEGWPIDSAIAAVKATHSASVTAARSWLLQHQGGSGARGVRSLRRIQVNADTVEESPPPPHRQQQPSAAETGGTRSPVDAPSATSGAPRPSALRETDLDATSRESSSLLGSRQNSCTGGPATPRTVLPWLKPSPCKREGGTIALRVRVVDGSVVDLSRSFHPLDSLRTVMHEVMRQYPIVPAPHPSSLSFVVPVPRRTYTWSELDTVTLESASVGTRALLILQVGKPV